MGMTETIPGEPAWLRLLREQCESRTIAAVAREIGYQRPSVSLALLGRYPGRTENLANAVLAKYGERLVQCPHLETDISSADCSSYALRPMPLGNAADMRHWRACQRCHHNRKRAAS